MKRLLLTFLAFLAVIAMNAEQVSKQEALQKAQQFMPDKQFKETASSARARSGKFDENEEFYIFNAEDKKGFVIVSGDDRTEPILGYSDTGCLDLDNLPPNLKGWLEGYSKQIKVLETSGYTGSKANARAVARSPKVAVEPLITTKWGQYGPYNLQCPEIDGQHCVTGCVATAMAQIMYYHKWPQDACAAIPAYTTGTRQIQMDALPPTTFKWDKMRNRYWEGEQGESAGAVAELMRYCGQAVEMDYDINESGSGEAPWHFINYFGYGKNAKTVSMSQYTITQWEDILYKELSEGRPIIYWGANLVTAHDFICDGYDGNGYYHFNWGWSGDADGFFLLSVLFDNMYGGYVVGQSAIIGLQPENGEVVIPYVYSYYGDDLSQTDYSRTSVSEDFTNVSITGGTIIQYETEVNQDISLDYGLGLYKDEQLLSVLDYTSATLSSTSNISFKQMNATFGANLNDGVYQIRSIYRFSNSDNWQACYDSYQKYIVATITGNTLLLRKSSNTGSTDASFIVNSVNYSYNSKTLIVNLTNTGDSNQEILYIWQKNDERYALTALACSFIEPGKTGDVYIALGNTILTSGSVVSVSSDAKVNNVKWEGTIDFPESTEQNLTCSNVSIANYDNGILRDSKLVITLSITNTGNKVYDDGISFQLQKATTVGRGLLVLDNETQPIVLDPGETKDIQFVIPNLEANFDYRIFIHSIDNGLVGTYLAHESFFVVTHSYEYDGVQYSYVPNTKTASVIRGNYQNLESVSIPVSITINGDSYQVVEIASGAFKRCDFLSVTLPEGLLSIGSEAFFFSAIKSISLPSTLKCIYHDAFRGTRDLKEICIPEGAVSVGYGAFALCHDLEILRLPSSLNKIEGKIIIDCGNLKYVYSALPDPIKIADDAFLFMDYSGDVPKQITCPATLIVPKGSVEKYQAASDWNVFTRITDKQPYKLTYVVDGEIYKTYDIEEETGITPEPAPTKEGYTFSGWSEIPEKMPAHDVTITGTFTINKYKLTYKVDDAEYKSYDVEYGATITPEPAPTKEGYNFSGWSEIPATMPAHDVTVTGTFTIVDPVTIAAKSYSRKYGEENPNFEYTSEGATLTGTPEITCEATVTSPVGEYPIVISKGTVTNYNDHYVNGVLTITKAPLTITAKSYTIKQGDALPTFEAEYSGFKNNETASVLTTQPTITTSATSASEPGTYDIVASGASATNYDISYVKGTLTITKADEVVVTAKSYSRKYGEANPAFEYTVSGGTLTGTPSITCSATATSAVGEYDIVVSKGSVTNYNVTFVNGKLTVAKSPLTITAKSYTIKQGDALPAFEAEYSGFKNDETNSVLSTQPTISTTATSASEPGTYEITVSGASATNYNISYVKGTLTISAVEVDPVTETETTTFSETVNENTDLSNTIIDNTYFTMNAENGDGYDATEQAIVLNSTTSAEQMNTVQNAKIGDATMQSNYNGIVFEVPAGNGTITVEAKTIGSHILNVQIGKAEPNKITKSERGTVDVPYNVTVPTYVYLYASTSGSSSAPKRAAAANSVLLYSYKVTVTVNGISVVTYDDLENAKWYTMDGLQLQGKPTKKGLYIVNGRKVVVK